jgi:hypothetical protein
MDSEKHAILATHSVQSHEGFELEPSSFHPLRNVPAVDEGLDQVQEKKISQFCSTDKLSKNPSYFTPQEDIPKPIESTKLLIDFDHKMKVQPEKTKKRKKKKSRQNLNPLSESLSDNDAEGNQNRDIAQLLALVMDHLNTRIPSTLEDWKSYTLCRNLIKKLIGINILIGTLDKSKLNFGTLRDSIKEDLQGIQRMINPFIRFFDQIKIPLTDLLLEGWRTIGFSTLITLSMMHSQECTSSEEIVSKNNKELVQIRSLLEAADSQMKERLYNCNLADVLFKLYIDEIALTGTRIKDRPEPTNLKETLLSIREYELLLEQANQKTCVCSV